MDDEVDDDPGLTKFWRRVGLTVSALLIVGGLVLIGFIVMVAVALNSWSSNK